MGFFGTDRQPVRKIWVSETESVLVPATTTTDRIADEFEDARDRLLNDLAADAFPAVVEPMLYGPNGEVVLNCEPCVSGLSEWLPEAK